MWFIQQNYKFVYHTVHFEIVRIYARSVPGVPQHKR